MEKEIYLNNEESTELILMKNEDKETEILYEDVSRRKENTKHFRMKNGNFMAVVYDEPVHKLNEKTGKLEEIKEEFTEGETDYEASMKSFKVKLPKKEGKRKFVTVEKDGKSVSFRFASGKPTHTKRPEAKMYSEKKHYWELKKYPSIRYDKVDSITSLEYEVFDGGIKENIVLAKCPETSTFKFDIKCNGLTPKLSEDKKTVLLLDEQENMVMVIPPSNMMDDNGVYSEDIHYELCESENVTTLEMVVENDWLSISERKYPVVIDPRIDILDDDGFTAAKMREICSNGSVVKSGTDRMVGIDGNGSARRIYMKIDLPDNISHERIISANLTLKKKNVVYTGQSYSYSMYALRGNGSFDDITWSNQPRRYDTDKIGSFYGTYSSSNIEVSADITDAVTSWFKLPRDNEYYTILLKKDNETASTYAISLACDDSCGDNCGNEDCGGDTGTTSPSNFVRFYSNTAITASYRPQLFIKYHPSDVYGDHQKFHTFEVGRAGTGSINLFSGKLSFAHGDTTAEGIPLPLSVSHLYRKEYISDAKSVIYGKGWRLSVEQSVSMGGEESDVIATYTDAQGKKHYFIKNDRNYVTDENGLGFTFVQDCEGYPYAISDEKQNIMYFDSSGNMAKLKDSNGNVSYLVYENGKLSKVKISSPVTNNGVTTNLETLVATFTYSNGMLSMVTDADGRNTIYTYNSNGCLTSVQYPAQEGETLKTVFTYDSTYRLISVTDYTGIKYALTYDNIGRVATLSTYGSKTVTDSATTTVTASLDDIVSFEYRATSTAIKSSKTNIKTVFNLDENGREISSYQDLSCLSDAYRSNITATTLAEVSGYAPVTYNSQGYKIGKYRSLSVTMNKDASKEFNYIDNGLFKETSNSLPTKWTVSNRSYVSLSSESYISGTNAVRFAETSLNQSKWISQTVSLRECELKGNVLVASAWAKATGQRISFVEDAVPKFRLVLTVVYENGTSDEYVQNFDPGCETWQYAAIPFILRGENAIATVTLKIDFSNNTGECYVTNARIVEANGVITTNEYTMYEDSICLKEIMGKYKNIKTKITKEDGVLVTKDYLDDKTDLVFNCITYKGDDNHEYHTYYEYDEHHNVIKTKDYRGMVIEYEYKDGKQISKKTYHENTPNNYMYSKYEYGNVDANGTYVNKESDPRYKVNGEELKTETTYDQSRNILLNRKEVNGQVINYSYDEKTDDLESISSTVNSTTSSNTFSYRCGYLTKVAHNGFDFKFDYDEFGREKAISIAGVELFEKEYNDGVEESVRVTYNKGGNNEHTAEIFSDIFGNVIEQKFDNSSMTVVTYDSAGAVESVVDNLRNIRYNYTYNSDVEVEKIEKRNATTDALISTDQFVYDSCDRITSKIYGDVGHTYQPIYEKDSNGIVYPDNEVAGIILNNHFKDEIAKDGLRRAYRKTFSTISGGTTSVLFTDTYDYLTTAHDNGGTIETEIVSSVSSSVSGTNSGTVSWNYTYDKSGNLETVSNGTTLVLKYYYDGLNRLVREDNKSLNKTYVWSYDIGGNITQKKVYPYTADINLGTATETYAYTYKTNGWKDQLVSYNGKACEYDVFGNPTKYLGKTLEWSRIKLLTKFDTTTFEYGANGIRCKKNNTVYTLDGNRILKETDGTKTLIYYYGGSGVAGFNYNGTDYYFRKNIQGDITEIYTSTGARVAGYSYDAWGKCTVTSDTSGCNIATINPFRYRGYYFDVETGLYYLQTRYYDPETGRFINSDTTDVLENAKYDINGLNLYAYCDNNPVSGRDDEGNMSFWKKLAIAAAVVVAVAVVAAVVTVATGGTGTAALCAVASTFVGAAKGAVIGAVTGAVSGAVTGAVTGAVEGYKEDGWDGVLSGAGKGALKGAVEGAQDGLLSGMVMGGIGGAMNPSFCFVAGTTVLTTLGKKAIETIQIGDTIPCVDHITGEAAEKKVISTSVNKVNRIVELDIDGEIIKCTETHPFQVKDRGWVDACNLNCGDIVYTKDWNTSTIKSVSLLELDEPVEVFNFEVEDYHTYYAGDRWFLVHNINCTNKPPKFHSKTIASSEKVGRYKDVRIDVELGGSGKANIHMTARGYTKMYYKNGTFPTAPTKLANSDFVKSGLKKAFNYIIVKGLKL